MENPDRPNRSGRFGGLSMRHFREYRAWLEMRRRCSDTEHPGAESYVGRGITVCDEWRDDFPRFLADVGSHPGPGYSLDRLNNDLGYFPGNVAYRTQREQMRNTRRNRLMTLHGETRLLCEWCEIIGIAAGLVTARLRRGWAVERALTQPVDRMRPAPGRPARITLNGETRSAAEWAALAGTTKNAIEWRMRNGWPLELALVTPTRARRRKRRAA